ncbi:MAG TPA: hypothetical protein VGC52_13410 [Gemmatimonadaceae bacterium]
MPSIDPNFSYALPTLMFLPALFQVRDISDARDQVAIDIDAREFMAGYADDLRHGRRQSIIERYDRRGAYRVGEGEKNLESWELIRAAYLTQWTPPARFAWRDLSYEVVSENAVIVIGLFEWGLADGRSLTFSYTGLLVRSEGELKIRLEDESMSPKTLAALNSGKSQV